MDFERHCAEIVTQTELLTEGLTGVDLTARVPSCPEWSLGGLLRHLGGAHAWIEEIVLTGPPSYSAATAGGAPYSAVSTGTSVAPAAAAAAAAPAASVPPFGYGR